ncbi:hypothetical protein ACWEO9_24430, partial [Streptomyces albidoflavus]
MSHPTSPARTSQRLDEAVTGGIGDSPLRPDSTLKVTGEYAYSSDLWAEDMLWGSTLRMSFGQQRLWFLEDFNEGSTEYHSAVGLRLTG